MASSDKVFTHTARVEGARRQSPRPLTELDRWIEWKGDDRGCVATPCDRLLRSSRCQP